MLDEGRVDILSTDAHHPQRRPPLLAEGREAAARWVGAAEATHLVETRPLGILENRAPDAMPPRLRAARTQRQNESLWRRLFGRAA
jgi:protein-tyrosine phosphatase